MARTTFWERDEGEVSRPLVGYRRREPEKTVLHEVVSEHFESPGIRSRRV